MSTLKWIFCSEGNFTNTESEALLNKPLARKALIRSPQRSACEVTVLFVMINIITTHLIRWKNGFVDTDDYLLTISTKIKCSKIENTCLW